MENKPVPYNKLTDSQKENIVAVYYKGVRFSEISKELHVSERAVSRVLKERGINTLLKNRYTLNQDYFEDIDGEEKAYWLGFIYADGFVGDEHFNNIVLSLTDRDLEHLQKFAAAIEYTGEIRINERGSGFKTDSQSATINFSSPKMASDLRKLGLYPNKSTTMKTLPSIDEYFIPHFIRGYFDGDGMIGCYSNPTFVKGKHYVYQKPNFNLIGTASFLREIEKHLPTKIHYKDSKSENMYYLRASGKKPVLKIMTYLYGNATIYLKRKYDKWQEIAPLCRNT